MVDTLQRYHQARTASYSRANGLRTAEDRGMGLYKVLVFGVLLLGVHMLWW